MLLFSKNHWVTLMALIIGLSVFLYGSCSMPKNKNNTGSKPEEQPKEHQLTELDALNIDGPVKVEVAPADGYSYISLSSVTVKQSGKTVTISGSGNLTLKIPELTNLSVTMTNKAQFLFGEQSKAVETLTFNVTDSLVTSHADWQTKELHITADNGVLSFYKVMAKDNVSLQLSRNSLVSLLVYVDATMNTASFVTGPTIDGTSYFKAFGTSKGSAYDQNVLIKKLVAAAYIQTQHQGDGSIPPKNITHI